MAQEVPETRAAGGVQPRDGERLLGPVYCCVMFSQPIIITEEAAADVAPAL